jgi:protocatechuate 3,4-dioxygenase beta subunit
MKGRTLKQVTKASPGYFDAKRSAKIVNDRMSLNADSRLRSIMSALVKHVHAAIRETSVTTEEWAAAIQFLTDTGHMCSQWRQEFILLSDVLGISMLVDATSRRRHASATESTVLGPFHVAEAARYPNGANICLDEKGEPLVVRGAVRDPRGSPIAGAEIDVWQSNSDGFYDVQQKGVQPEGNLRGIFTSDRNGAYWLKTVKPHYYEIPKDGPVGQLLQQLGRHATRAAHIHFIVRAAGYESVTTQVFDPDCPYLEEDAVFGVKRSLIGTFEHQDSPAEAAQLEVANPFWSLNWDFVLSPLARDGEGATVKRRHRARSSGSGGRQTAASRRRRLGK